MQITQYQYMSALLSMILVGFVLGASITSFFIPVNRKNSRKILP